MHPNIELARERWREHSVVHEGYQPCIEYDLSKPRTTYQFPDSRGCLTHLEEYPVTCIYDGEFVGTRAKAWAYDTQGRKIDHRLAGTIDGKLVISRYGYAQIALGYIEPAIQLTGRQLAKVDRIQRNFDKTGQCVALSRRGNYALLAEPITGSIELPQLEDRDGYTKWERHKQEMYIRHELERDMR